MQPTRPTPPEPALCSGLGGGGVGPGVAIGAGTVAGAGSIVVRDLPAGVLAVGNPCRIVRRLDSGVPEPHG